MSTATAPPDPVALLAGLDADTLERRLAELDAERKAVSLVLRSVRARDRARRRAGLVHAPAPERVAPGRT
jgi:hypothetical protein